MDRDLEDLPSEESGESTRVTKRLLDPVQYNYGECLLRLHDYFLHLPEHNLHGHGPLPAKR